MAYRSETILISGSSGFTGLRLADALTARNYRVKGLSREASRPWEYQADLEDGAKLEAIIEEVQPDVVIHLAGISSPAHPSLQKIYAANISGTLNLLTSLSRMRRSPRLTVVASSAAVYAAPEGHETLAEDSPLKPGSHYGVSKLAVEHVSRLFEDKLSIQIVRPFNYTGSGQPANFLVPKIVDHFARDAREIEIGNLNLYRDISSVDDVIETYLRLIDLDSPTNALNICSGEGVRLANIIDILKEISGRQMRLKPNSAFFRSGEPLRLVGSRERLDRRIGVWPRRTVQDILSEMYASSIHPPRAEFNY